MQKHLRNVAEVRLKDKLFLTSLISQIIYLRIYDIFLQRIFREKVIYDVQLFSLKRLLQSEAVYICVIQAISAQSSLQACYADHRLPQLSASSQNGQNKTKTNPKLISDLGNFSLETKPVIKQVDFDTFPQRDLGVIQTTSLRYYIQSPISSISISGGAKAINIIGHILQVIVQFGRRHSEETYMRLDNNSLREELLKGSLLILLAF